MLRRVGKFQGSRVFALDDELGKVRDVYFDDEAWIARYLVVDLGGWLPGRKVLIAPQTVELIDPVLHTVSLSLTRRRVEESPNIDTDKPVSRQHETELLRYYGHALYWTPGTPWAAAPLPPPTVANASDILELQESRHRQQATDNDGHLRSAREVSGYTVSAVDGRVGHVTDFLLDDETWSIRYLVVDMGVWLFGHQVLVGRDLVRQIDWVDKSVEIDQTRPELEAATQFDPHHLPPGDIAMALNGSGARHRRKRRRPQEPEIR